MSIAIRTAGEADVAQMSRILSASITALCSADHGNDPAVIAAWTANKTEDGVRDMMRALDTDLYVAEHDGNVVAVGAIAGDAITLNYVDPVHRRTGVSRAMLEALERLLVERGVSIAHLKSTATAHAFYLSQGWEDGAPVPRGRFITAFPMFKRLAP
jgi:GNAT superfamily N-acetyltransferase